MSDPERLQAENESLREEIDGYRQRELADLRQQLAEAKSDVVHYRAEAERNANTGRQIYNEAQAELTRLRDQVRSLEELRNDGLRKRR